MRVAGRAWRRLKARIAGTPALPGEQACEDFPHMAPGFVEFGFQSRGEVAAQNPRGNGLNQAARGLICRQPLAGAAHDEAQYMVDRAQQFGCVVEQRGIRIREQTRGRAPPQPIT